METISHEVLNKVRSVKYGPYIDIYWSILRCFSAIVLNCARRHTRKETLYEKLLTIPSNFWALPAAVRPMKEQLFTYITGLLWWEIRWLL